MWTKQELRFIKTLSTPSKIQNFLDSIPYSTDDRYRSPRDVIRDRKAHCFDGAVFAAAMLQRLKFPPLIVDMQAVRDDDHVIAIYRTHGRFGAIAKSNMSGLRYREPVYRDLRELVMSYFDSYFNVHGAKSMRQFTIPLDLTRYHNYQFDSEVMEEIGLKLSNIPVRKIMTPAMIRNLQKVDDRLYKAGMLGSDKKGIFIP